MLGLNGCALTLDSLDDHFQLPEEGRSGLSISILNCDVQVSQQLQHAIRLVAEASNHVPHALLKVSACHCVLSHRFRCSRQLGHAVICFSQGKGGAFLQAVQGHEVHALGHHVND
jgi:hypothetical protein